MNSHLVSVWIPVNMVVTADVELHLMRVLALNDELRVEQELVTVVWDLEYTANILLSTCTLSTITLK